MVDRKNKKGLFRFFQPAVLLLAGFLMVVSSIATPLSALALTKTASLTPEQQASSFAYYKALRTCISVGQWANSDWFNKYADMDQAEASSYAWFWDRRDGPVAPNGVNVGAINDPKGKDGDGFINCGAEEGKAWIKKALTLWGYESGPQFLCSVLGFTRQSAGVPCTDTTPGANNKFYAPSDVVTRFDTFWTSTLGSGSVGVNSITSTGGAYRLYLDSFLLQCRPSDSGTTYTIRLYNEETKEWSTKRYGAPDADRTPSHQVTVWDQQTISCADLASRIDNENDDAVKGYVAWIRDNPGRTDNTPPGNSNRCEVNPTAEGCDLTAASSCRIEGIGWLLCPVVNFLSVIVDAAYAFVSSLLVVQPLMTTGENTGAYGAWSVMRTVANVAFVIAFLIIIFSQLTGVGVSNYGVKKLLPRLVISAILVNASFWVCAIAVDISNIAGSGARGVFESVSVSGPTAPEFSTGEGWAGITGAILAGTAVAGGVAYAHVSALLPALITAGVAILAVFIVLTLRQALIILLIVIAPLAFVAFLLPNTEDLFKKWRSLLTTLLLMYPIIGGLFGASALASQIVMASADDNIPVQIMGAAISIIPLALTPIIMRVGGGVLNRVGAFVNNPSRGPIDRLRKGAENINKRALLRRDIRGTRFADLGRSRRAARRDAVMSGLEQESTRAKQQYVANSMTKKNGDPTAFANRVAGGTMFNPANADALQRALAGAKFTIEKAELEDVKAAHTTIDSLDAASLEGIIHDKSDSQSAAKRAAAIERLVKVGGVSQIQRVANEYAKSGKASLITKTLANSLASDGPQFLKASDIDNIANGRMGFVQDDDNPSKNRASIDFEVIAQENISAGVYSQEKMATASNDELKYAQAQANENGRAVLQKTASDLKKSPTLSGRIKHNRTMIDALANGQVPSDLPPNFTINVDSAPNPSPYSDLSTPPDSNLQPPVDPANIPNFPPDNNQTPPNNG